MDRPAWQEFHKWSYGLTMQQFDDIYTAQNGRCRICSRRLTRGNGSTGCHVDHNHSTGRVRGLLCSRCNKGLGMFQDNIRLLAGAIVYLQDTEDEWDFKILP